jgi:hypothetical protein
VGHGGGGWIGVKRIELRIRRSGLLRQRITPSAMSPIQVKSRCICPWLNPLIGSPARIALAKSIGAMSGRPQGPYTVKKRRPVAGSP